MGRGVGGRGGRGRSETETEGTAIDVSGGFCVAAPRTENAGDLLRKSMH